MIREILNCVFGLYSAMNTVFHCALRIAQDALI